MTRPDYCPISNEPCQSMCTTSCKARKPLTPAQRRTLIDQAGDITDGLNQDDFADEIIKLVEAHHGVATQQAEAPTASNAEPIARIEFRRGEAGRENEMPRVVSCNWLPDGIYEVYLADPTGVQPCCGEYAKCRRPCTPRGRWLALATQPTASNAERETLHVVLDRFEAKERGIPQAHIAAQLVAELRAALATQPTASNAEEREELLRGEVDAITKLNHAQWLALENVRTLAARNRKEEWAQHLLRWCEEAGNASRTLRAALAQVPEQVAQDKIDAERYRLVRRGQHWSVIDGIGNVLRGEQLDKAVDDAIAINAMRRAARTSGEAAK